MRTPALTTARLQIREFEPDDLHAVHQLLGQDLVDRRRWLEWTTLAYEQLAKLNQPPYGDRAMVLRDSGQLVGACGFAPCLGPFDPGDRLYRPEIGLFWTVSPAHQRQGYATEAGRALVRYAFDVLKLRRIIATTDYANAASISVMRKLGMRLERNPSSEPAWLQMLGVLEA